MSCKQAFHFGPGKRYVSWEMIEVPVLVERTNGLDEVFNFQTYGVDVKVSFIVRKETLKL